MLFLLLLLFNIYWNQNQIQNKRCEFDEATHESNGFDNLHNLHHTIFVFGCKKINHNNNNNNIRLQIESLKIQSR